MHFIDLSPLIGEENPVWPGDTPFSRRTQWAILQGDSVSVSSVTTTTHIGAHIDAPSHVREGAPGIESIPIDACIGACVTVEVTDLVDTNSSPHRFASTAGIQQRLADLRGDFPSTSGIPATGIERILLKHRRMSGTVWDPETPGIDPAFVRWFAEQGGRLIGIDLQSFDPQDSKELPAHQEAASRGVVMLEGLDLSEAPEGSAELYAPPIPWHNADAAPVRAVLRIG